MSRDFLVTCARIARRRQQRRRASLAGARPTAMPLFEVDNRGDTLFVTLAYPREIKPGLRGDLRRRQQSTTSRAQARLRRAQERPPQRHRLLPRHRRALGAGRGADSADRPLAAHGVGILDDLTRHLPDRREPPGVFPAARVRGRRDHLRALLAHIALRIGLADLPGGRKQHEGTIPRHRRPRHVRGLRRRGARPRAWSSAPRWRCVTALGLLVIGGAADDMKDISPRAKFSLQLVAALFMTSWAGVQVAQLGNLLGFGTVNLTAGRSRSPSSARSA